jgi:hypothetical protein
LAHKMDRTRVQQRLAYLIPKIISGTLSFARRIARVLITFVEVAHLRYTLSLSERLAVVFS